MATSVKLDDDLKSRIQRLADIRHRSAHWIMREAIRDYVEREEARERFKQEALMSWTAYREVLFHWREGHVAVQQLAMMFQHCEGNDAVVVFDAVRGPAI